MQKGTTCPSLTTLILRALPLAFSPVNRAALFSKHRGICLFVPFLAHQSILTSSVKCRPVPSLGRTVLSVVLAYAVSSVGNEYHYRRTGHVHFRKVGVQCEKNACHLRDFSLGNVPVNLAKNRCPKLRTTIATLVLTTGTLLRKRQYSSFDAPAQTYYLHEAA